MPTFRELLIVSPIYLGNITGNAVFNLLAAPVVAVLGDLISCVLPVSLSSSLELHSSDSLRLRIRSLFSINHLLHFKGILNN